MDGLKKNKQLRALRNRILFVVAPQSSFAMEDMERMIQEEKTAQVFPYMSQWHTSGMHRYRTANEDSTVYYIDETRNIHKKIVDKYGNILGFPGVKQEDFWAREVSPDSLKPQIRFPTDFERRDGRIIMLWQIQPDGRYWEDDDGFGGSPDEEVTLYAFLDEEGNFDGPFRIYQVGTRKYCEE